MCSCTGNGTAAKVEYKVSLANGTTTTFKTTQEANAFIRANKGGTMRAVAVK